MALIDDDQVEEVSRILLVKLDIFAWVIKRLIQREIHLAALDRAPFDLVQRLAHGREGEVLGLVYQHIAVGQIQDAFLALGFPQAPDDLEGDEGLACAGRHREQDARPAANHGIDGAIDGDRLVVAGVLPPTSSK